MPWENYNLSLKLPIFETLSEIQSQVSLALERLYGEEYYVNTRTS